MSWWCSCSWGPRWGPPSFHTHWPGSGCCAGDCHRWSSHLPGSGENQGASHEYFQYYIMCVHLSTRQPWNKNISHNQETVVRTPPFTGIFTAISRVSGIENISILCRCKLVNWSPHKESYLVKEEAPSHYVIMEVTYGNPVPPFRHHC